MAGTQTFSTHSGDREIATPFPEVGDQVERSDPSDDEDEVSNAGTEPFSIPSKGGESNGEEHDDDHDEDLDELRIPEEHDTPPQPDKCQTCGRSGQHACGSGPARLSHSWYDTKQGKLSKK